MATVIDVKGDVVDNDYGMMYDWFGYDYISPSKVNTALANSDDGDIVVNIASNGGDVFAAAEIYSALKMSNKKVTVNIQGLAASAASVIAMAGEVVNISPVGQIMIHKAMSSPQGNADDMQREVAVLNGIDESIAAAYELKTGMTQTDLLQLMSNETWMNAQTAVDKGFADNILFVEPNKMAVTNSLSHIPTAEKLNEFMNFMNFKNRKNIPDESKKQANLRESKLAILLKK